MPQQNGKKYKNPHGRQKSTEGIFEDNSEENASATKKPCSDRIWRKLQPKSGIDVLMVLFNGLLALFTYFLWQATNGLWEDAHKQLNAMQGQLDVMKAEQRPWLAVDLTATPLPNGKGLVIPFAEKKPIVMPLRITVTKSVAKAIDGKVWVEVLSRDETPHLESANWKPSQITAGIFFPGAPIDTVAIRMRYVLGNKMQSDPMTHAEFQGVMEGRSWIAVHGIVEYRDASDIPHWTKFCFPWTVRGGFYNQQSCAAYNAADQNR